MQIMRRSILKLNQSKIETAVEAVANGTPVSRVGKVIDISQKSVFNYLSRGEKIVSENAAPSTPDDQLCKDFFERIAAATVTGVSDTGED